MTGAVGQDAVTEGPACLLEATEGLHTDDTIDGEAPLLLEGADRTIDGVVENAVRGVELGVVGGQEPETT